jgi:hypothetical protein
MKKPLSYTGIVLWCFAYSQSYAQAFEKNNILLSLGLGMTSEPAANNTTSEKYPLPRARIAFTPVRPQLHFKAECAVHKYLSTGLEMLVSNSMNLYNPVTKKRYNELNVKLAATVDFHFYQLMADKMHNGYKLHADKWDIYAGFSFGNDFRVDQVIGSKPVYLNKLFISYHIGVRYRINEHWGIFGEIGYGQRQLTWNIGIVYYFGGPKKRKREIRDF